jgi:hypothetical protein
MRWMGRGEGGAPTAPAGHGGDGVACRVALSRLSNGWSNIPSFTTNREAGSSGRLQKVPCLRWQPGHNPGTVWGWGRWDPESPSPVDATSLPAAGGAKARADP